MTLEKLTTETKLVWWPSPQDYNEAVQNPDDNFSSPQLRESSIFVGSLGLPRPVCGAFASVYRIRANDGSEHAVRCFLRNIADQQTRYELISSFVQSDQLPYTVSFEFEPNGIKVRNDWFPVLKMDWVTGQTLEQYVIANTSNPGRIGDIAKKFVLMCYHLREAGIAHGDLQHGNVLVTEDGDLRLVDYDGMYVPAMDGFQANELGHRNYQHPGRSATHFGPYLDNFSAWVIYASLKILSIDPSLLAQLRGGDESLLFKRTDFENPMVSQRFAILEAHENDQIRKLAKMVRYNLTLPVDSVPAFTETLPEIELPPLPAPIRIVDSSSIGSSGALPEWLREDPSLRPNLPDWMIQEPGKFVQPMRNGSRSLTYLEPELAQPVPRKVNVPEERITKGTIQFLVVSLCLIFWWTNFFTNGWTFLVLLALMLAFPYLQAYLERRNHQELVRVGICVEGEIIDIRTQSYIFAFRTQSGTRYECERKCNQDELRILRNSPKAVTVIYGGEPEKDAFVYKLSSAKAVLP